MESWALASLLTSVPDSYDELPRPAVPALQISSESQPNKPKSKKQKPTRRKGSSELHRKKKKKKKKPSLLAAVFPPPLSSAAPSVSPPTDSSALSPGGAEHKEAVAPNTSDHVVERLVASRRASTGVTMMPFASSSADKLKVEGTERLHTTAAALPRSWSAASELQGKSSTRRADASQISVVVSFPPSSSSSPSSPRLDNAALPPPPPPLVELSPEIVRLISQVFRVHVRLVDWRQAVLTEFEFLPFGHWCAQVIPTLDAFFRDVHSDLEPLMCLHLQQHHHHQSVLPASVITASRNLGELLLFYVEARLMHRLESSRLSSRVTKRPPHNSPTSWPAAWSDEDLVAFLSRCAPIVDFLAVAEVLSQYKASTALIDAVHRLLLLFVCLLFCVLFLRFRFFWSPPPPPPSKERWERLGKL